MCEARGVSRLEDNACRYCEDGGSMVTVNDYSECGSFDFYGPLSRQNDLSSPVPSRDLDELDQEIDELGLEDCWGLTEDEGSCEAASARDQPNLGGGLDMPAKARRGGLGGATVSAAGRGQIGPVAGVASTEQEPGSDESRQESGTHWTVVLDDLAFAEPIVRTMGVPCTPSIVAGPGGAIVLFGHGPVRLRSISDLFQSPWCGTRLPEMMQEAVRAQRRVRDLVNLVLCGRIRLVRCGEASGPCDVEMDMPVPAYSGTPVLPGCSRVRVTPDTWWLCVDGLTHISAGPKLLCNNWFVPVGVTVSGGAEVGDAGAASKSLTMVHVYRDDLEKFRVRLLRAIDSVRFYVMEVDIVDDRLYDIEYCRVTSEVKTRGFAVYGVDVCIVNHDCGNAVTGGDLSSVPAEPGCCYPGSAVSQWLGTQLLSAHWLDEVKYDIDNLSRQLAIDAGVLAAFLAYVESAPVPRPGGTCALDLTRRQRVWDSRGYDIPAGIRKTLAARALGVRGVGRVHVGLARVARHIEGDHMGREPYVGVAVVSEYLRDAGRGERAVIDRRQNMMSGDLSAGRTPKSD